MIRLPPRPLFRQLVMVTLLADRVKRGLNALTHERSFEFYVTYN